MAQRSNARTGATSPNDERRSRDGRRSSTAGRPVPPSFLRVHLVAILVAVLLTGCGTGDDGSESGVELVFWHSLISSATPALDTLVSEFEAAHPHIRVRTQYVPSGNAFVQKLVSAVYSGNAPDVAWNYARFEELAQADAIYSLDEWEGSDAVPDATWEDVFPPLRQLASWRGTRYGVPFEATSLALLYNKDLFRAAGLDPERPPRTWDELRTYVRRLTVDEDADGWPEQVGFLVPIHPASSALDGWMVWQWQPFLWQAGGALMDTAQTQVLFDREAGIEALAFWKELYEGQGLHRFASEGETAFASQQAAMILDGPWNLHRYPDLLADIDWGIAPLPAGPVRRATNVSGEFLVVFKQTEHPEAAWTFVRWMLRPEVQARWAMQTGYLPVRRSVLEREDFQQYLAARPNYRVYVEALEYGRAQRPIDVHGARIIRHVAEAVEQATVGEQQPELVLRRAAEKANRLLADGAGE